MPLFIKFNQNKEKVMKLYTKIPKSKKFRFIDPLTNSINPKKNAVMLHPTESIEFSKEDAKQLLTQDPHLVSETPYKAPKKAKTIAENDEVAKLKAENELLKKEIEEKKEIEPGISPKVALAEKIISQSEKMEEMKVGDLAKIGASIGLEIKTPGKRKDDIIEMIITAAKEILE